MSKKSPLARLICLLIAVPLLVFLPVVGFAFVTWDDPVHITQNKLYQPTPFAHIGKLWSGPYFGDYIPLSRTVWAALATPESGATQFDPSTYHAANLCLHIANVLLVFFILRFFVKKDWAAALGALLFAIHPLQVEPVAWVSGLRDLLCAFFSLACLLFYLMAIRQETADAKKGRWLAGASACYVLALLSKSSAVCVPLILLLIDYVLNRTVPKNRLFMLAAWLAPAVAISLVTKHAEKIQAGQPPLVAFWQRPFVAGDTIGFYLWKLFVPHPLGVDYGRTPTWVMSHAWAYLPILVPIALIVLVWRYWKSAPWLAIGIGIFLICIAPVSGIVPFSFQIFSTVADRYMYFAMLGPALIFATALSFVRLRTAVAAGVVVLVCLGYLTVKQVPVWANTITLFLQGRRTNPSSIISLMYVGEQYENKGDNAHAITYFRIAARTQPIAPFTHVELAKALINEWYAGGKRPEQSALLREARHELLIALREKPDSEVSYQNLGSAYYGLGQMPQAIAQFQEAIRYAPDISANYYNLALACAHQGNGGQAKAAMKQAASLGDPDAAKKLKIPIGQWK